MAYGFWHRKLKWLESMSQEEAIECPICMRITPRRYWHKHHLVPRCKKGLNKGIIRCCINCGNIIHKLFTNKELAKKYNSIETILANPDIQKWAKWIKNKPNDFSVCMATKKKKENEMA